MQQGNEDQRFVRPHGMVEREADGGIPGSQSRGEHAVHHPVLGVYVSPALDRRMLRSRVEPIEHDGFLHAALAVGAQTFHDERARAEN